MTNSSIKRLNREEVQEKLKWDLTDLFQTNDEWQLELNSIKEDIPSVTKFRGKIAQGPDVLLKCIENREALLKRFIHVATYAKLNLAVDGTNPLFQSNCSKTGALNSELKKAISFIKTEIIALPEGKIEEYLEENIELNKYSVYLQDLQKEKKHALHDEAEYVLAGLEEILSAPIHIYEQSKSSDMTFSSIISEDGEELPVSFSLYENKYEVSPNTHIRRKGYQSFINTLKQYQQTYAAVYATEVKKQVAISRLRNYDSVTDMLLQSQKVKQDVYHRQLDVILNEFAPHMRRYAKLKKKVLNLKQMKFCDLKANINIGKQPKISYEEAVQLILDSVSVLGEEYSEITKKAIDERWVDLADNIGKSTDAFCSSPYGKHPYILLTWSDTMRSVFTLTHELGHAVHSYFAERNQLMIDFRSSFYFVEGPSTLNEILLGKYLLSKTNECEMRRWVILQMLDTYYHNFVTHLLEGELQRRVYNMAERGHAITASVLTEEKYNIIKSFWGDSVEVDKDAGLTWMRQSHYYLGLYPYTYSAGLTVATAISEKIDKEGEQAVEQWLNVLKAGGSIPPLELIKKVGVDMSKEEPIKQAVDYVGNLIDELCKSFE